MVSSANVSDMMWRQNGSRQFGHSLSVLNTMLTMCTRSRLMPITGAVKPLAGAERAPSQDCSRSSKPDCAPPTDAGSIQVPPPAPESRSSQRERTMNAGSPSATVVLVHGGFVRRSGWQAVYELLELDGKCGGH
jgi:hypothetical protein